MDRKSAGQLQGHMLGTYFSLRWALAGIAIALPIVVAIEGWIECGRVWIGPSISHYYYVSAPLGFFTTRDLFVGGLIAAAACLYAYRGFSTRENVALNLAGIFAFLVAVLPTATHHYNSCDPFNGSADDGGPRSRLDGTAAVLFFLCIAYVTSALARHATPSARREASGVCTAVFRDGAGDDRVAGRRRRALVRARAAVADQPVDVLCGDARGVGLRRVLVCQDA